MEKIAVEKYIYENVRHYLKESKLTRKVFREFFEKIKSKHLKEDDLFFEKSDMARKMTPTQLLDNLDVKKKFRVEKIEEAGLLFHDAILELKKIDLCQTPRDKLVSSCHQRFRTV